MMTTATRTRRWTATRVENWATPGFPDVDLCDELGRFHKVELKTASGQKVALRPHQVAYLSRHAHASVWILVQRGLTEGEDEIYLYHGRQAVDVAMDGLKTPPVVKITAADNWNTIFDTISPPAKEQDE
jgi:hypothetical protein